MRFSIIMPVLNEAAVLPYALQQLIEGIAYLSEVEIIISDGGSTDNSSACAAEFPVLLVDAPKGRARQMNAGASKAMGEWLVFLHADTRLPDGWMAAIENSGADWGRFNVRLSGPQRLLRLVEWMMNWRSCKTAVATGDQAMFFRRDLFERLGGYPDLPLMEDIAISKSARAYSRPACLECYVITSSRRWEQRGIIRTIVLMWWLRFAYWLGISPETLHQWYYDRKSH